LQGRFLVRGATLLSRLHLNPYGVSGEFYLSRCGLVWRRTCETFFSHLTSVSWFNGCISI